MAKTEDELVRCSIVAYLQAKVIASGGTSITARVEIYTSARRRACDGRRIVAIVSIAIFNCLKVPT